MQSFKLTTWNVEHADKTLTALESHNSSEAVRLAAARKMDAIASEISEVDADILFVCEGPRGEDRAQRYFGRVAPNYRLVTRNDPTGASYKTQGSQWLWFLVRDTFAPETSLLPVETWQAFTRDETDGATIAGRWLVSLPSFDFDANLPGASKLVKHDHYRHPQTLFYTFEGKRVEIIGLHLKSKFVNQRNPALRWKRPASSSFEDIVASIEASPGFMVLSVVARAKLTTEATDVRAYIERRFKQEENPAIFVVGDFNDGPGKELIENWFMLHDLIGNLQGDVFFAQRFLNHALFDNTDNLRWSVFFKDAVDPRRAPQILLDHILFTQSLSGRDAHPLRVLPNAGRVEHDIHERISSLLASNVSTSDHRPVSVTVSRNLPQA